MSFVLFAAIGCALALVLGVGHLLRARGKGADPEVARESTPALDAWVADSLEHELAEGALGMRASTPEERRALRKSLKGEPDPDVVSRVESNVRAVELEFVKYAHDADAEVTLRVRYEDGKSGIRSKRMLLTDIPEAVRTDFERRASSRVFRAYVFPWARVRAL